MIYKFYRFEGNEVPAPTPTELTAKGVEAFVLCEMVAFKGRLAGMLSQCVRDLTIAECAKVSPEEFAKAHAECVRRILAECQFQNVYLRRIGYEIRKEKSGAREIFTPMRSDVWVREIPAIVRDSSPRPIGTFSTKSRFLCDHFMENRLCDPGFRLAILGKDDINMLIEKTDGMIDGENPPDEGVLDPAEVNVILNAAVQEGIRNIFVTMFPEIV